MKHKKLTFLLVLILTSMLMGTASAQDDHYVIGMIGYFTEGTIEDELRQLGYIEGENITYLHTLIEGWETMPQEEYMVVYQQRYQEVVTSPDVDLFLANTDTDVLGLLPLLSNPNIPVVFARSDDPVATGIVQDLVAPGGNVTGIVTNRPHERRLQILTEMKPDTDAVYYLYNTTTGDAETILQQVQLVGEELGVEVIPGGFTDVPSAIAALENIPEGVDWMFLTVYVPFDPQFMGALYAAAFEHQAGIAGVAGVPFQGYTMGYGPSLEATDRQAARIVDRVLRGVSPAELPIEIAQNELVINLEAAAAINLEVPVRILRQADLIVRPGDFNEFGMYIGNS